MLTQAIRKSGQSLRETIAYDSFHLITKVLLGYSDFHALFFAIDIVKDQ